MGTRSLHDTVLDKETEAATARVVMEAVVELLGEWHVKTGDYFLDAYRKSGPSTAHAVAILADRAKWAWQALLDFVDDGTGERATEMTHKIARDLMSAIALGVRALEVHLDHNTGWKDPEHPEKPGHVGPHEMRQMLDAAMKPKEDGQ